MFWFSLTGNSGGFFFRLFLRGGIVYVDFGELVIFHHSVSDDLIVKLQKITKPLSQY